MSGKVGWNACGRSPPAARWLEAGLPAAASAAQFRLESEGLELYPHLHHVVADGRDVALTPTEFVLLETLLRSGRVVRSKAELARTVRGDDADGGTFVAKADERTIEVHVGNLRGKLARRLQDQGARHARPSPASLQPREHRQHEARRLAGASLGDADQVAVHQHRRDRRRLDRGRIGVARLVDGAKQFVGEAEVGEAHSGFRLGGRAWAPAISSG